MFIFFVYLYDTNITLYFVTAEVEGYGPYKPVPPPKPLPAPVCHSPPPYRMPPYPLYSEPTIPGAATGIEAPNTPHSNNLHTHSSKFPVSRKLNFVFFFK